MPWYPVILASTYVIQVWIESGVSLHAVERSLVVAIVLSAVLVVGLTLMTRRPHLSGLAAMLLLTLVATQLPRLWVTFALAVLVGVVLGHWRRVRGERFSWPSITKGLNAFSAILAAVVVAGGLSRGIQTALVDDFRWAPAAVARGENSARDEPDIVVLLLDGYPRADAVADLFGGDNTAFLESLRSRGFAVASDSRSNYPYTQATLVSMLHMRPLYDIGALRPFVDGQVAAYPLLRTVLNDNPVFRLVRERGYSVVATNPGYEHVALRSADVFFDDGSLNEIERHLLRGTTAHALIDTLAPDALADQHRHRIQAAFDFLDGLRLQEGRFFAFIHVPSPHMPVVIDQDGSLLRVPPSEAAFRRQPIPDDAKAAYLGQLGYLNSRTLDAIDHVLAQADGSVVVVMSDHGAPLPPLDGRSWTPAHYENLLAIRTPEGLRIDLPEDASPMSLFPRIFNALFGAQLPIPADVPYSWVDVPQFPTDEE